MTRTLLVGGSGTLGHEIATCLRNSDEDYTLLSRSEDVNGHDFIKHDLADIESIAKIDLEPFSRIIYLAQSRNYKDYPSTSNEILDINYNAAIKFAEKASALGLPYLYASTGSVYAKKNGRLLENDPYLSDGELTMYSASKISAEVFLRGIPKVTIIRPFYVFGNKSDAKMLIPRLFGKVVNNEEISLTGNKGLRINPIYAKDAARAALLCFENEIEIANIAGSLEINLGDLINEIGNILGIEPKVIHQVGDNETMIGDISKLKSLGFQYEWDLKLAIEDFWVNYRN